MLDGIIGLYSISELSNSAYRLGRLTYRTGALGEFDATLFARRAEMIDIVRDIDETTMVAKINGAFKNTETAASPQLRGYMP